MDGLSKVTASHLARTAVVYVRQSTMLQVRDHTESTARQYGLAGQAATLGWPAERIEVIDTDLGVSGRFSAQRKGFRQVVSLVCLGEVGAVLGLEVSRLARSSADFSRLLEFARLTDTLLIDGDGIYDLSDFNDRLLLGLKGTMSEAELHLLSGRLHGARRAAAARGQLRLTLPIGLVYDEDGQILLDPDDEIQTAIADVFAAFEQHGSAFGVAKAFADRRFPSRVRNGPFAGTLRWGRLTYVRVSAILKNPMYAGAYVFGRSQVVRAVTPDGAVLTGSRRRQRADWPVLITDHHQGFITWQQYLDIEAKLAANRTNTGARPPREGTPLCQGIIYCGACGYPMSTRYRRCDGTADYVCCRAMGDAMATGDCHSIACTTVDTVVSRLVLQALTPEQIALALASAGEVHDRHARCHRAAELAAERARYEAGRAERAFEQVEPENRLVARNLEARWETKLAALADAEAALADMRQAKPPLPEPEALQALAVDLPRLWDAPTTTAKDRKRLLRTLIADVIVREVDFHQAHIGIRWHTGAVDEVTADRRANRNPRQAVETVRQLLSTHNDAQIAEILNQQGIRTGKNRPFTAVSVRHIRKHQAIGPKRSRPCQPGELTVPQVAQVLNVHEASIYPWIRSGLMQARQDRNRRWCIPWNKKTEKRWKAYVAKSNHLKQPKPRNDGRKAV